jgi:hypothetical protein
MHRGGKDCIGIKKFERSYIGDAMQELLLPKEQLSFYERDRT